MKKIALVLVVILAMAACKTKDKSASGPALTAEQKDSILKDSSNYTTIEWIDSTTKELGELKKDQTIEISYRFRNSGNKMLVIQHVQAGCGCTIPKTPEKPYGPGEEGTITATFNGSGHGPVTKTITVTANTQPTQHILTFKGTLPEN